MTGRFGAVVTAMVTPFREDHSLDLDAARQLASYLYDHGTETLVVAGSTGESPTLGHGEKLELFRAIVDVAKDRGKVLCGTGTYNTAETIELSREAQELGADGLLLVTPYYNKPPQRGLLEHFTRVADAVTLPIMAYNVPGRTGIRMEHDTLLRLAEVPNIVAVKDSTGDFQAVSKLISEAPPDFEVYSGDDWATFGYLCLGAVGIVSVAAHLVGDRIAQLCDLVFSGDIPAARKIHEELTPLFNALFITSNPIPVKTALEMVGRPVGPPRLPLVQATKDERERIRKALEDAGLL
ncbi:MAG TPA: 4-hydroxy-tetrahydrodipicolinate synthase [Actinomycetota bacterium]|nr:4-hydroxy-tetrahydrodipicolinate synthase [Actinomycetota bacterium]